MGLGVSELFSGQGYWLEATILIVFFVVVNMFPCIRSTTTDRTTGIERYLPTPIQALTDSLGRSVTNLECCARRYCVSCAEMENYCQCPPWIQSLVEVAEEEDAEDEEDEGPQSCGSSRCQGHRTTSHSHR